MGGLGWVFGGRGGEEMVGKGRGGEVVCILRFTCFEREREREREDSCKIGSTWKTLMEMREGEGLYSGA